jgi:thiamine pyrophosphate-dependent acetolactate synthase large subunit-like protein
MTGGLRRREVVLALLAERGDLLVVAGLGAPAWDCAAAGDHPLTFPLWGGMGQAAMVGLGLACARPDRRVLVVTGDGELLMGLGALATIGAQTPPNLSIVVLDNERYGETGMQATHTAYGVDLAAVAGACGFPRAATIIDPASLAGLRTAIHEHAGPVFAVVKVRAESPPLVLPPRDGALLVERFHTALTPVQPQGASTAPRWALR